MEKNEISIELWTLIIAIIALVQPWIIYLYKKYLKVGSVTFFETGNIEIGFSNYASTIGINGTIRSLNDDFYVSRMSLELIRDKDSSKHIFDWAIFRDTKISLNGDKQSDVELPYGILLTTQSPTRLNVQFHDRNQQEDMRIIYDDLSHKWQLFLEKEFPYEQRRISIDTDSQTYSVFEDFNKLPDITEAYTKFHRIFYWDEGTYSILLKIQTSKPDKIFIKEFKFSLTEEECKTLRYNVITLNDLACGQSRYNWNFIYANFR